jgi:hypothetical protein
VPLSGARQKARRSARAPRDLGLRVAGSQAALDEQRQLQRLQAFALLVLDHLVVAVGTDVDEGRDVGAARELRGAQPACAKVQQPAPLGGRARSHRDWLAHAALADRLRELVQRLLVELEAGLTRILVDRIDGQAHRLAVLRRRAGAEQIEAFKHEPHVRPPSEQIAPAPAASRSS